MNVKLGALGIGVLFFTGVALTQAQTKKRDTLSTKEIDEVVVSGYQTKKRAGVTTAVSQVQAKDINNIPITTFDQILAGKAPGVDLNIGSGQPGSSASVVIRGAGSINGNTTPLYIVDGVPVIAGAFASINPNDIESVSILKDAAAKSIYGSQAGAGVILVTTKQGRKGDLRVEYIGSIGISLRPQAKFNMMSTAQITQMQKDLKLIDQATYDARNLIDTKWDDIFLRTGLTMSNDLSVSGGGGNTTFKFSLGHLDQKGIAINSGLQRITSNINLRSGNGKNFRVGLNALFGFSKIDNIGREAEIATLNPYGAAFLALPYQSLYNSDGSLATGSGKFGANAYELATTSQRRTQETKATAGLFSEYDFTEHLTARVFGGVDYTARYYRGFVDPLTFSGTTTDPGKSGSLNRDFSQSASLNTNAMLSYKNSFGDHNVSAYTLAEYTGKFSEGFNYAGYGLEPLLGNVPGAIQINKDVLPSIGGSQKRATILSYLANADYNYMEKYYISANIRRDGGSAFSKNYKWGTFGGVSLGWAIHKENFLEGSKVSNLKLRASWGVLGNAGNLFSINVYNQERYMGSGQYNDRQTLGPTGPFNPNYRWEKERQVNIGLDFGFWNNRLSGTLDFYNKTTFDLYLSKGLSRTNGYDQYVNYNAGEMRNRGIEAGLSYDIIRNEATRLNVNANFSYNQNKILALGDVNEYENGTSIVRVGLPLGSHYSVKWGGVDPQTGAPIYLDRNDQRMKEFNGTQSQATFGSSYAPYSGGFGMDFSHKGFYISGQFQWKAQYYRYNNMRFFNENAASVTNYNQYDVVSTYWKTPGQITDIQNPQYSLQFTSKFIENSSFLRLRNLRVGYNFNKEILEGTGLKEAGIFLNATNVFTWTKWTGLDPDDNNNLSSYEYPSPRIFTMGVSLTF